MKTTRLLFVIGMSLALIGSGLVGAQDLTPTYVPTATLVDVSPVATEEAATGSESDPVAISTEAVPIATIEATSTQMDSTSEATTEATSEVAFPTLALPSPTTISEESSLQLVARDLFDTLDPETWLIDPVWALKDGAAQTAQDGVLRLAQSSWQNVAVQVDVFLSSNATTLVTVRGGVAGGYTVALNAAGEIVLYRQELAVQTAAVPNAADGWYTLRLTAIDTIVTVSVDDVEVIAWQDTAPLSAGEVSFAVQFAADSEVIPDARLDNVFVWVTPSEWTASQAPQPTPTLVSSPTLVPSPTQVVSEIILPSPTVASTPIPTLSPTPYTDPNGKVPQPHPSDGVSAQAADNDNFVDADIINNPMSTTYTAVGNTEGASLEVSEPQPSCGFNVTNTIWFQFTPQTDGTYTLSTTGSSFDTILAVYTGSSLSGLTQIACNDDMVPGSNVLSRVTMNRLANQTVWIQLSGYGGDYGPYTLTIERAVTPPPLAPLLQWPSANITVNAASFGIQWQAAATGSLPRYYLIEVDNNPTFTSLELSLGISYTGPVMAYSLPANLLGDGAYSVRLRAGNYNGQLGSPSISRVLTLDTTPPAAPVLSAPADGLSLTTPRPTLTWAAITGAVRYRVDIARDDLFTDLVLIGTETTTPNLALTSLTLPAPLTQGGYYWRASARDAAGNWSADSVARLFWVNFATAPAHNAIITSSTTARPTFTWAASTIPNSTYKLEIAQDSDFTAWVYETAPLTGLTHTLPAINALSPGIYFYRIWVNGVTPNQGVYKKFTISPAAPPAPAPISPAIGAVIPTSALVLQWGTPPVIVLGGPFTYDYQVDNQTTFVSPESEAYGLNDPLVSGLSIADGLYSWRARTVNAFGVAGPWMLARSFTLDSLPPTPPVLTAPVHQSVISVTRPILTWQALKDAKRYRVDLSFTDDFGAPLFEDIETTAATLTLNSLLLAQPLNQSTYYWRVSAQDAAGNWSAESATSRFSVDLATAPLHKAALITAATVAPKFTWAAYGVTGTTYNLEVSADGSFSVSFLSPTLTTLTYTLPAVEALSHGRYYWRVWVNGSPQEAMREFAVTPSVPGAPVLTGPTTASVVSTPPNLTWNIVNGLIDHYEVQVDNNANFISPEEIGDAYSNEFLVNSSLAQGVYSWRVRAINAFYAPGAWSVARTFTLDMVEPPVPNLVAPINNAILPTLQPTFSWQASVGANRYLVQVSTTPTFDLPMLYTATTLTLTPPAPLLATTYYWRAAAMDVAGNVSAWSTARTVTVQTPPNAAPLPNRYITGSPFLTWTPVSWSQGYEINISTTPTFVVGALAWSDDTIAGSETGVPVSSALANGTYYWRIRARSGPTTWGAWSTNGILVIEAP